MRFMVGTGGLQSGSGGLELRLESTPDGTVIGRFSNTEAGVLYSNVSGYFPMRLVGSYQANIQPGRRSVSCLDVRIEHQGMAAQGWEFWTLYTDRSDDIQSGVYRLERLFPARKIRHLS